MTELLSKVFAQVEQLPPDQQDEIAQIIERELEEREWDQLVAKPGSQRLLEELAAEALREDDEGRTRESTDRW